MSHNMSAAPRPLPVLRQAIDEVDSELLCLLNKRAQLSLEVGRLKASTTSQGKPMPVFDPRRESELLARLAERNEGPLSNEHVMMLWREILSVSRALQRPYSAAYLGPEGTFSYFAGVEYLGSATRFQPCGNFTEIFQRVASGQCDCGLVPLENSLQGTIGQSFDLFARTDVVILGEFFARISHSLLSRARSLLEIQKVYSHPQPLGQCGAWLRTHLPQARLVAVESTAAAAKLAAGEPNAAAVGHYRLGELMRMEALATCIEDNPTNWTRFVLIGAPGHAPLTRGDEGPHRSSLLFTLSDKPGALASVLEALAGRGVNMRKLESRPLTGECWKYIFFADVECDMAEETFAPLRERLSELCTSFRILGSYPEGPHLSRLGEETLGARS